MSDPAWINAGKANTAIGTATIAAATNLLTIAGHGLGDGDTVTVDTLTGGGSALTADAVYFVRDVSGDDFALSLTLHGPQVEFASDGGADVYHYSPQYTAAELRRLNSGRMTKEGVRLGARSGIHPAVDPPISVSGTTWTVHDLTADFNVGLSSADGPYTVAHLEESGSLDPADGSSDRIDALDLQIQDDDTDASGFRRARVVYVSGTPGSGSPPSLTSNAFRLGTILVPAGGSPEPSVSTDAQPQLTVAAGGTTPVRDSTEGPSAPYEGQMRYRRDLDAIEVWDGSAWALMSRIGGWYPIQSGEVQNSGAFDVGLTDGGRFPAGTFSTWKMRINGRADNGTAEVHIRVNDISTSIYRYVQIKAEAQSNSIDGSSTISSDSWRVADWGAEGGLFNSAEFTLSVISGGVVAQWQSTDTSDTNRRASYGGGRLDEGVIPTKLTLIPGGGATEFVRCRWEVEGYITPDFEVPSS